MDNCVIAADGLGKRYRIRHGRYPQDGLRHVMADWLTNPLRRGAAKMEDLWAVRDVSFEVERGEVLGVIGRNGSGKTTLLKLLSRITPPTEGRARLTGRVGSLLEVGTGFHPDLTGRENIYLNGAILGMRRREIDAGFDEIVAFAEVERFLDMPVKRYSSGMYVRLAFAIAAHLQPEILLIDEVLAVGDVRFQAKCLGKMRDVARGGRTALFVSHNMSAVRSLCDRAMVLESGRAELFDDVDGAIRSYMATAAPHMAQQWRAGDSPPACCDNDVVVPLGMKLLDENGDILPAVVPRSRSVSVELDFELKRLDRFLTLGVAVYDATGNYLFHSLQTDGAESDWLDLRPGRNRIRARLPMEMLNEGEHRVVFLAAIHKIKWLCRPDDSNVAVSFTIAGGMSQSPYWQEGRRGLVAPIMQWRKEPAV